MEPASARLYSTHQLRKPSVVDSVEAVPAAPDVDADLDAAFAALGDRTRRAIVTRLARGEATVGELAEPFDLTHQAISRHVGILRRCRLIHQRIDGQRRPCRLNIERMQELSGWITEQQRDWESRLNRLEEHLASMQDERAQ
jgi:DNA-binding transcriptional ArsR family regulator